jgi:cell filamentation protein
LEKGHTLNLNPPDNIDVFERYMSGTIEGDVGKLAELIGELFGSAKVEAMKFIKRKTHKTIRVIFYNFYIYQL